MIAELQPIKDRITEAKRATRDDISEALGIIDEQEGDRESEIMELVEGTYNAEQSAKLITSLDSY